MSDLILISYNRSRGESPAVYEQKLVGIMRGMPDEPTPARPAVTPIKTALSPASACSTEHRMVCERCGGSNVYRMHAVWRCADCGFKTDCCGW
jgi:hypothetical protein